MPLQSLAFLQPYELRLLHVTVICGLISRQLRPPEGNGYYWFFLCVSVCYLPRALSDSNVQNIALKLVKVPTKRASWNTWERSRRSAATELELYQRDNDTPSRPGTNLLQLADVAAVLWGLLIINRTTGARDCSRVGAGDREAFYRYLIKCYYAIRMGRCFGPMTCAAQQAPAVYGVASRIYLIAHLAHCAIPCSPPEQK